MFTRIHANLKDYLKHIVDEAIQEGIPVIRPVFYHYNEPWTYKESTEYLLGNDILVAPVLEEGVAEREVKLPNDTWVNLFTEIEYQGGTHKIQAPIGQPPVFIRKESKAFKNLMGIRE